MENLDLVPGWKQKIPKRCGGDLIWPSFFCGKILILSYCWFYVQGFTRRGDSDEYAEEYKYTNNVLDVDNTTEVLTHVNPVLFFKYNVFFMWFIDQKQLSSNAENYWKFICIDTCFEAILRWRFLFTRGVLFQNCATEMKIQRCDTQFFALKKNEGSGDDVQNHKITF